MDIQLMLALTNAHAALSVETWCWDPHSACMCACIALVYFRAGLTTRGLVWRLWFYDCAFHDCGFTIVVFAIVVSRFCLWRAGPREPRADCSRLHPNGGTHARGASVASMCSILSHFMLPARCREHFPFLMRFRASVTPVVVLASGAPMEHLRDPQRFLFLRSVQNWAVDWWSMISMLLAFSISFTIDEYILRVSQGVPMMMGTWYESRNITRIRFPCSLAWYLNAAMR